MRVEEIGVPSYASTKLTTTISRGFMPLETLISFISTAVGSVCVGIDKIANE